MKVNAVLLKGLDDRQLDVFLAWIKDKPIELRFIELMQSGGMDSLFRERHVSGELIKQLLLGNGWVQQQRGEDDGPAQVFMHPDLQGRVGLIMPYGKDFCAGSRSLPSASCICVCSVIRGAPQGLLGSDTQREALQQRICRALVGKAAHRLHQGNAGMTTHLASIGG